MTRGIRLLAYGLACAALALVLAPPTASGFENEEGTLSAHGFGEVQLRALANDFDASDDWDLAQWYNILNVEMEWDAVRDGWGPFDYISFYSRIEVRYDCVWNRGCGTLPKANAYGDRANHLPKQLVTGRRSGYYSAQNAGDRRRFHSIERAELDYQFRNVPVGHPRQPAFLWMLPGFETLFNNPGSDGMVGTRDDPSLEVFGSFLQDGEDERDAYRFAVRRTPGAAGGVGTQILGPWFPRHKVEPIGSLRDRWNPFNAKDVHPFLGRMGFESGAPLRGGSELPYRQAPRHRFDNPNVPETEPKGLYIPNRELREMLLDGDFDAFDQNFRQAELEWNHGASQQDEKELKELYVDLEFFESRLWLRLGKQNIVWGKTELFRTSDQFNPQDLALASLPTLEESRIALWAARAVWSFYNVGPLQDVRLELAVNIDQYEPTDLGRCGEPFSPLPVCNKTVGLFAHGITGAGLAGEVRPPNPWNSWKGVEVGVRLEFRWDRFSVQISDFYGYDDMGWIDPLFIYERNVDPRTGRPRRAEARGGCRTGEENDCLGPGDDALFNHPSNQQLFAMICSNSIFFSPDLDPTACGFTVLGSNARVAGAVPVSNAVGALLAGSELIASALLAPTPLPSAVANVPFPSAGGGGALVNLGHSDPATDRQMRPGGVLEDNAFFGFYLTPEQEALFGCGDFYDTACEGPVLPGNIFGAGAHDVIGGIDLLNAEASAIFQSWPGIEGTGSLRDGDLWDTFDRSLAQPGTMGFEGGPVCTRYVDGKTFILPGCRGPGDPGYDVRVDGLPVDALGDALLHPYTGQAFRSEVAAISWNALVALVLLSGFGDEDKSPVNIFDPAEPVSEEKCSLRRPILCSAVKNFFDITGVQRNITRAGGNLRFGRRDFSWHGGSAAVLRYEKRNVLGFAVDFAEDVSKSNWSLEATWIEGLPFADNDDFDRVRKVDTYNLTVSVDRPTFVNFLNANRTFFLNAQVFFQYVRGYETSFPTNGPWNVLATFTINTGYFQDRLLPSVTFVYDVKSNSGGVLWQTQYRMTENFSATIGMNLFHGRFQRKTQPIVPLGPLRNQAGEGAYRSYVENGLSPIRNRDEIFLRIRYTF